MKDYNTNILKAINNFNDNCVVELVAFYKNSIRIQQAGDALEYYIKDLFCNTVKEKSKEKKCEAYSKYFSYLGNANNPPDAIIKNSDAIEVKKIANIKAPSISLNSSFPKDKLYSDDRLITNNCKDCEKSKWKEKDMLYAIGAVNDNKLHSLWFVYGDCYAANKKTYEKIKNIISNGVNSVPSVELSKTKELGRVNKVDPLGITYLRIRGMWGIDHPNKVFYYISKNIRDNKLNVLMLKGKYNSFPKEDKESIEKNKNIIIENVKLKDPNNPAKSLDAVYIHIKGD